MKNMHTLHRRVGTERIADVIHWLPTERKNATFWRKQIMSPRSLKEKFDRLEACMREDLSSPQQKSAALAKHEREMAVLAKYINQDASQE